MAKEETVRVAATQGVDRDNTLQLGIGLIGRIFLEKIHLISLQYLQYVSRAVSNAFTMECNQIDIKHNPNPKHNPNHRRINSQNPQSDRNQFELMPQDILELLLLYLDIPSIGILSQSSRQESGTIAQLASDEKTWLRLVNHRFRLFASTSTSTSRRQTHRDGSKTMEGTRMSKPHLFGGSTWKEAYRYVHKNVSFYVHVYEQQQQTTSSNVSSHDCIL